MRKFAVVLSAAALAFGLSACSSTEASVKAEPVTVQVAAEPKVEPTAVPKPEEPKETVAQKNARRSAERYLESSAFSKSGLVGQLKYEGYSEADAAYGVNSLKVNWNAQAALKAEAYLETSPFSRSGLVSQLKYEGFTTAQANYGATAAGL